ncbi:MAG: hypothetical protein A2202_08055 [Bdellovibrionales bacterium RIFOXYA1_FULL_36_14]|nr:MAG: hypothetical protein A2202_08055 [Bdellovibrionales bacterium RIFOXYA1_FULL_36_14]
MEDLFYKKMLMTAPFGYAYHRIILDNHKNPVDYEFLEINEEFEKLTGLKAANILGKTIKSVQPDIVSGDFDWIKCYGQVALNVNQTEFEQYSLPLDKWFRVQAYSSKKYYFSTIFTDITKRIQMEKEKEQLQVELFHASKLATLGTLSAGVAHEINNPLAIIVGAVDLIEGRCKNLAEQDFFKTTKMIRSAVDRVSLIIKGLKTYAKKDPENCEGVDVHSVINETLLFLKGVYKNDNIEIMTGLKAPNFKICASRGKLQQVIVNLLNNAKDALESRPHGLIQINTHNYGNNLVIEIIDNGAGIPEDYLPKLFDPFFTTKAPGKGTGLGLSICQSITESFGGKISAKSKLGEGSTFKILLPLLSIK